MKNKTALITGSAKGIGKACALAFAQAGYNVIVHYQASKQKALETLEECKQFNNQYAVVQFDVSELSEVESAVKKLYEEFESIDVLVNNAGITKDNLLLRMQESDFDDVIDTNLKGTFNMVKTVSKNMFKAKYGRIINVSSVIALTGNVGQSNYAASKAGIIGFSKSIAKELASKNITCNVVAPGYIQTDMTQALPQNIKDKIQERIALKRLGTVEDVANAVLFLASEQASYITGQVLVVDGGMVI